MRIAITGATGVLGKCLVEELAEQELVLIGLSVQGMATLLGNLESTRLITCDYSVESLTDALRGVDAVVHLAAIRHQEKHKSFFDYSDNIRICENVYAACHIHSIRNVVFASTRAVYSPEINEVPFLETQFVSPRLLYGLTKFVGECIGLAQSGLNLKCLRLAQVIARHEREGYMLSTFLQCAQHREPITVYGEGAGCREYLYVRDAARAIRAALLRPEERGIFNVGSGVEVSHRQLAEAIVAVISDGKSEIVLDGSRTEDTSRWLMDSTKFRNTFGWVPDYTLEDALREIKRTNEA